MPDSRPPAWHLVSLRPQGEHGALRRAAARHGGAVLALSPWRLQPRRDGASRDALAAALQAPVLVFTSPAAVRAAGSLVPLAPRAGQHWLAVGAGTAAALRRSGIAGVLAPSRMDSEGMLALPALASATRVGLVTAPEGRGLLAASLAARGTVVDRADVYDRVPVPLADAALARLAALEGTPACMALSSEQALRLVLARLPADAARVLRAAGVAAASERLAALATGLGWTRVVQAASPRPAALARAAASMVATMV